jgi:hypothetical protein
MKRRHFLAGAALATKAARATDLCGCAPFVQAAAANDAAWQPVESGVKVTGM